MVGATRSMRVRSVTLPPSIGTLRSTRSSTRLPFTSTSSRVRNLAMTRNRRKKNPAGSVALPDFWWTLDQLGHRRGGVRHAVGEAPLVVVPGQHAHEIAALHLGLVHR